MSLGFALVQLDVTVVNTALSAVVYAALVHIGVPYLAAAPLAFAAASCLSIICRIQTGSPQRSR